MGEFPEHKLKDIGCTFLSGFGFKSSDYKRSGIPLIKIGNIQNRIVTIDPVGDFISEELIDEKTSQFLLNNNDVLIAMTGQGSVGRVGRLKLYNERRPLLNQRVGKFICDEINISIDFLYYILTSEKYQDYLFSAGSGSGQPNLSPDLILDTEIPYTDYKAQRIIASILSSLDDKIDLLHRQNKTLEALAETLFRKWFVEEADESWEEKSLVDIADYLNGLALQKFPSNGFDDLPVIKIREMKQGISENTYRCSKEIPSQYIIQDGDILFSWSGSLEVVIWNGGEGALNQHLFKVSSAKYPKWFYYLATKHHLPTFISIAESKTTTMGHIQREHLKQATIAIPQKEFFNQFDRTITPLIEKQIKNNYQIRTLTQLRDTLLPKLMSGEVRVKI